MQVYYQHNPGERCSLFIIFFREPCTLFCCCLSVTVSRAHTTHTQHTLSLSLSLSLSHTHTHTDRLSLTHTRPQQGQIKYCLRGTAANKDTPALLYQTCLLLVGQFCCRFECTVTAMCTQLYLQISKAHGVLCLL